MKRNKHFDKLFKQEFDKTYNINITTKDIFEENQLKRTNQISNKPYYKLTTIGLSLIFIILSVLIGIKYIHFNNNYNDFVFETVYFDETNNILNSEEIKEIKKYCDYGFLKNEARYSKIADDITLYVYEGRKSYINNKVMETQIIFIYVFDFDNEDCDIVINIDNQELVANKEARYGILKVFEKTEDKKMKFTLSYRNVTKECVLKY